MSEANLITIKQAAAMMACHTMTVRRRMDAGELGQVARMGRKCVRLSRAAVEEYIAKNTGPARTTTCEACGIAWPGRISACPECGAAL
jgi:excisionase family DNA binding protein